jgi:hypothetical protein
MKLTPRIQFYGPVPVPMLLPILAAAEKHYKKMMMLDGNHPLSKATGATLTLATEESDA